MKALNHLRCYLKNFWKALFKSDEGRLKNPFIIH